MNYTSYTLNLSKQKLDSLPTDVLRLGAELCWARVKCYGKEYNNMTGRVPFERTQMAASVVVPLAMLAAAASFNLMSVVFTVPAAAVAGMSIAKRLLKRLENKSIEMNTQKFNGYHHYMLEFVKRTGLSMDTVTEDDLKVCALAYQARTLPLFEQAAVAEIERQRRYPNRRHNGRKNKSYDSGGNQQGYYDSGSGRRRSYQDDTAGQYVDPFQGGGFNVDGSWQPVAGGFDVHGHAHGQTF